MKAFILKYYKLLILLIAIGLLAVFLLITFNHKSPAKMIKDSQSSHESAKILDEASEIEDEGEYVIKMDKNEVYSFQMTDNKDIILNFERKADKWIYSDDTSIELNQERVDKILNYLTDVRFLNVIALGDDKDSDSYGLNQDSPVYVIKDANDYSTYISLGSVDEKTGQVYFALNYDFSNIYVNSGKLAGLHYYSINDLVQ